jgi:hypothetical protein
MSLPSQAAAVEFKVQRAPEGSWSWSGGCAFHTGARRERSRGCPVKQPPWSSRFNERQRDRGRGEVVVRRQAATRASFPIWAVARVGCYRRRHQRAWRACRDALLLPPASRVLLVRMTGGRLKPRELQKWAAALNGDDMPSSSSDSSLPLTRAARSSTMAASVPGRRKGCSSKVSEASLPLSTDKNIGFNAISDHAHRLPRVITSTPWISPTFMRIDDCLGSL